MNAAQLRTIMDKGEYDSRFHELYGDATAGVRGRYTAAIDSYKQIFGDSELLSVLSVPGRSEVGGNHTDHNNGRVLACAVNLDIIAVASPNGEDVVRVKSEGFDMDIVDLSGTAPLNAEKGTSAALIRGVCARLAALGYKTGGFNAYTTSNVLKGSGLSSSAAFEVMTANMVSTLFNGGTIDPVVMAQTGQYAECEFFGKPCGLMDQTACAEGGFITIDFANTEKPVIEKLDFDFASTGYSLCIVDTAGNHADLSDDYAAIRYEMASVANLLGQKTLRACSEARFHENIAQIRAKLGDRAVLRAMHFFGDNARVADEVAALRAGDFGRFLSLVTESGRSSAMYLQNIYATKNPAAQGLSLALALAERVLAGSGAWRVHGGGFAGTIQAFVPRDKLDAFTGVMENAFGAGACHRLIVRPHGAYVFA